MSAFIPRAVFSADSLALGSHWCYQASQIAEKRGGSDRSHILGLYAPELVTYHPGKSAGDLTNNGDQAFVLLEALSQKKAFDAESFVGRFVESYEAPENAHLYKDHATKSLLEKHKNGDRFPNLSAQSEDLEGASRTGILFSVPALVADESAFVKAAVEQSAISHSSAKSEVATRLVAHVSWRLNHARVTTGAPLSHSTVLKVIADVAAELNDEWVSGVVTSALESASADDLEFITGLLGTFQPPQGPPIIKGLSCALPASLPTVIHFLAKYGSSVEDTLTVNIAAGGECAARAMTIVTILAAAYGPNAFIQEEIFPQLKKRAEIDAALQATHAE